MENPVKVLQIAHDYEGPFPEVCSQYNRAFLARGYQVVTLYLKGEKNHDVVTRTQGHKVIFLNKTDKELRGLKLSALKDIISICKKENFDILLGHRYKAIYLISLISLFLPDCKLIGVAHEFHVFSRFSRRILINAMSRKLLVLGVSDSVKADLRKACPRLKNGHLQTLYNSVDVEFLRQKHLERQEARDRLNLNENDLVIATVGRLNEKKDHSTLIRAFQHVVKQHENARLVIVGVGSRDKYLKNLAIDLDLKNKISFLGRVPNAAFYFKAFDVFVLPSKKEPFGMVILEAMVAEIPVVCSNYGGPSEVVENSGIIFESGNHLDLARCINMVIDWSVEDRDRYIKAGLERVLSRFSPQAFEENLHRISGKFFNNYK